MSPVRLHPRVYQDIEEALAYTREQFGPRQVHVYERLIVEARLTLRRNPTIGQLHEELGPQIRVFCIAQGRVKAPHGYIYKMDQHGAVYIGRLVHLARYLPDLIPEDF
jgi:plasmid stabilization system protein ParE